MKGKHHCPELDSGTHLRMDKTALTFYEVLNRGGFGIIYKGTYKRSDQREKIVAIKEYLPDNSATREGSDVVPVQHKEKDFNNGLKDFLYEAEILEKCEHANIVRFYEKFEAYGTAYIVMELVEGKDLSEYLKRRKCLSEKELKAILYPLLDALETVHDKGFLHRDIKPGNIVLRKEDESEDKSPVLLDFGSAEEIGESQRVMVTDCYSPRRAVRGGEGTRALDGHLCVGCGVLSGVGEWAPPDIGIKGRILIGAL